MHREMLIPLHNQLAMLVASRYQGSTLLPLIDEPPLTPFPSLHLGRKTICIRKLKAIRSSSRITSQILAG
jgi:hypothetical protein